MREENACQLRRNWVESSKEFVEFHYNSRRMILLDKRSASTRGRQPSQAFCSVAASVRDVRLTVLVPNIFEIDPAICLLMNGIGTLLYILVTKGKIPAYLGSSFAFLGPGGAIVFSTAAGGGYAGGALVALSWPASSSPSWPILFKWLARNG